MEKKLLIRQIYRDRKISVLEVNRGGLRLRTISKTANTAEVVIKTKKESLTFHLKKSDSKWMACIGYEVWRDEKTKGLTRSNITTEIKFA